MFVVYLLLSLRTCLLDFQIYDKNINCTVCVLGLFCRFVMCHNRNRRKDIYASERRKKKLTRVLSYIYVYKIGNNVEQLYYGVIFCKVICHLFFIILCLLNINLRELEKKIIVMPNNQS